MALKEMSEYFPKQRMLSVAEDTVMRAWVEVLKPAIMEMAADSDNKFDDMVTQFLPQMDSYLLPAIDKIDGEVG